MIGLIRINLKMDKWHRNVSFIIDSTGIYTGAFYFDLCWKSQKDNTFLNHVDKNHEKKLKMKGMMKNEKKVFGRFVEGEIS